MRPCEPYKDDEGLNLLFKSDLRRGCMFPSIDIPWEQCGQAPDVETKKKRNYGGISRNVGEGDASPDNVNLVIILWHSRRISARA